MPGVRPLEPCMPLVLQKIETTLGIFFCTKPPPPFKLFDCPSCAGSKNLKFQCICDRTRGHLFGLFVGVLAILGTRFQVPRFPIKETNNVAILGTLWCTHKMKLFNRWWVAGLHQTEMLRIPRRAGSGWRIPWRGWSGGCRQRRTWRRTGGWNARRSRRRSPGSARWGCWVGNRVERTNSRAGNKPKNAMN